MVVPFPKRALRMRFDKRQAGVLLHFPADASQRRVDHLTDLFLASVVDQVRSRWPDAPAKDD